MVKNDKQKNSYILTRETLGMTILLFSALVFVMLLTNSSVFAGIGKAVCTFMYGTFGYGSFLMLAFFAYLGVWLVFEKKIKISAKTAVILSLTVYVAFLLFHAVSTHKYLLNGYGEYISACYNNAELGFSGYTFGGIISALLVYPVAKATTFIGAYIIFSILLVLCGYLTFLAVKGHFKKPVRAAEDKPLQPENFVQPAQETAIQQGFVQPQYAARQQMQQNGYQNFNQEQISQKQNMQNGGYENYGKQELNGKAILFGDAPLYPRSDGQPEPAIDEDKFSAKNLGNKIIFEKDEFAAESYRRNMIFSENSYFNNPIHNDGDYLKSFSDGNKKTEVPAPTQTYVQSYEKNLDESPDRSAPSSFIYNENPVENTADNSEKITSNTFVTKETDLNYSKYEQQTEDDDFDYTEDSPCGDDDEQSSYLQEQEEYSHDDATEFEQFEEEEENQPITGEVRNEPVQNTPLRRVDASDDSVADIDFSKITRRDDAEKESKPDDRNNLYNLFSAGNSAIDTNRIEPDTSVLNTRRDRSNANLFDIEDDDRDIPMERSLDNSLDAMPDLRGERRNSFSESRIEPIVPEEKPIIPIKRETENPPILQEKKEPEKKKHVWDKYVRPNLDLLDDYPDCTNVNTAEIEESKQIIVDTLARFRIESEISDVVMGPAITRYDVIIKDKVNIRNSLKHREAIAMELKKENVNCYLNFAKGALSIEVPNSKQGIVGLKSMLVSKSFINAKPNGLTFALGKNYDGECVCPDITKMPHLLVAGTSGSGKSICLSSLIVSLLYKYGPEELRFILVDPKQVEFICYDNLPHLMINEIIYDVDKAIKALNWAISEMERRYKLFKEMTESGIATKDLTEYNNHVTDPADKLPKIVIILDEFGDLMLQARKDIEMRIVRLVQKARASGIHLILATQRPSVDCITGLIKSNLATRIGFKVGSNTDSMTIFDVGGAEKLIGKGDMYFRSSQSPELMRIQGCFIDSAEVQRVTDFVKQNNKTFFDESVSDFINKVEEPEEDVSSSADSSLGDSEMRVDDLFIKALHYCVVNNQASVSMIQRRFPCGYIKACKIVDWMTNMQYITPSEGSKPRKVLLSLNEFIDKYGEVDD